MTRYIPPDPAIACIQTLLGHWEHTCRKHLAIAPRKLPWLVFYDQEHAWHVSPEDGVMKAPRSRAGIVVWAGRKLRVHQVKNSAAGVWLPDGETMPAGLGAAVKPWPKNGRKDSATFVQIPLPSLFRSRSESGISGLHWYSLALYELTHTVQILTVLRQWRALQEKFEMP